MAQIADKKKFAYCRAVSLKDFPKGKVKSGDVVWAMLFPGNMWILYNSANDSSQTELAYNAVLGKDFTDSV
jgi:hypothetical protein